MSEENVSGTEKATLGGGCFWCLEAVYERIDGIIASVSGYAGGNMANPTYNQVSGGRTGHAEVIQIEYDPDVITFSDILNIFWKAHDPTTMNRQGADVGSQYRSIILAHDKEQQRTAEESRRSAQDNFDSPIVTEIEQISDFYVAEDYHQDYYDNNPSAGYCTVVISPKLKKLGLDVKPAK